MHPEAAHRLLGPKVIGYLLREIGADRRERKRLRDGAVQLYACLRICSNVIRWIFATAALWPLVAGSPGGIAGMLRGLGMTRKAGRWQAMMTTERKAGWPPTRRPVFFGSRLMDALLWACGPVALDALVRLAADFHRTIATLVPAYAEQLVRHRSPEWLFIPGVRETLTKTLRARRCRALVQDVNFKSLPSQHRRVVPGQKPGLFRVEPAPVIANRGRGHPTDLNEDFAILDYLHGVGPDAALAPEGQHPEWLADLAVRLNEERTAHDSPRPATGMKRDSVKKATQRVRKKAAWVPVPRQLVGTRLLGLLDELDIYDLK
ncbi:MAG: hypothetical protein HY905_04150 [Deltaproteobacteria bacterium]|nr:hypothetical protein [Deltaproteobacteria bacterium]